MDSKRATFAVDLSNCDKEPIHILGKVQAHSVLIAVREESGYVVEQISENCLEHFEITASSAIGQPVEKILGAEYFSKISEQFFSKDLEANPHYLPPFKFGADKTPFEAIAHRFQGILILEFEKPFGETEALTSFEGFSAVKNSLAAFEKTSTVLEFAQAAAEQVRLFTGFDRVMVYKFLEDGAGHVLAEDAREDLESYLNLHYPASDIPKQARVLYLKKWLRLIGDVTAEQSPIVPTFNPRSGAPLDLSYAVTRSMSPIHIEYLVNIGAAASMSISIIRDGALWGLIACHHMSPKYVSHEERMACEFLAHTLSLQLESKERRENQAYIEKLERRQNELIAEMSREEFFFNGAIKSEPDLLADFDAEGAALVLEKEIYRQGRTPAEEEIREISEWLWEKSDVGIYSTGNFSGEFEEASKFADSASGVLAVRLAKYKPEYLIWFRGEYKHSVKWAGNPDKAVTVGKFGDRLTPRKSFAEWEQKVQGKSKPWKPFELDFALGLRRAIVETTIRKADELAKLNAELERSNTALDSFAYVASHDLKEPLRGIRRFSGFLLEDGEDKLGAEELEHLRTVIRLAERMEVLITELLQYSRIGRAELNLREIDLNEFIEETLFLIKSRIDESGAEIFIPRPLPKVRADEIQLGEVFTNLITNAIKYNESENIRVEIGFTEGFGDAPGVFYIRDNGIGIDRENQDVIFRIFKRLHRRDEFGGGSGAGLTIAEKIIQRHGGRIWFESEPGRGTTFYFTLSGEDEAEARLSS